jgi:UDP-2,3-diacylglucosamine pyrophosphatase LpxH
MENLNNSEILKEKIIAEVKPEITENYRVVYSDTNDKATYDDNFILYHGDNFVEIIIDEELLNKKVKITLDKETIFNDILKTTDITIPVKKRIDIEKLAKHIKIEAT